MSAVPLSTACLQALGLSVWWFCRWLRSLNHSWIDSQDISKPNSRILLIFAIDRWQFWKLQSCQLSSYSKQHSKAKSKFWNYFSVFTGGRTLFPLSSSLSRLVMTCQPGQGCSNGIPKKCLIIWWRRLWDMIGYVPSGKRLHSELEHHHAING